MKHRFEGDDLFALTEEPVDEERVHQLWLGTRRRVEARKRRSREYPIAAAFVLLGAFGVSAWLVRPEAAPASTSFLSLAAGGVPGAVEGRGEPVLVRLADGSTVRVGAGGRWLPSDNRPARFESQIERGRVDFDVRPGGPRRWVIRAGTTTVEVLGTAFSIQRDEARTTVRVTRGRVAVTDDRLTPPRVVLAAGESLSVGGSVDSEPSPRGIEPSRDARAGVSPEQSGVPGPVDERERSREVPIDAREARDVASARAAVPSDGWRSLAEAGEYDEAYRVLGAPRLRRETTRADVSRLMLLADVARLSGHPADAVAPLERLLSEAPDDPRAPIAAVILGRICMDELRRPAQARAAFERALELSLPQALRPDAERRLRRLAEAARAN